MPLKTPLPEKIQGTVVIVNEDGTKFVHMTGTDETINQLIDVVAELREVVEKNDAHITNLRGGWTDVQINKASLNKDDN